MAQQDTTEPGTERLEAFSDGVFAVAITLLVFSIALPAVLKHSLSRELFDLWPKYLSYLLSFVSIGIIWAQHHSIFRLIVRTNHAFLLINVLFLMWLSFLPFPTGILGEYLGRDGQSAAMSFYAGTFLVGTIPFNLVWRYAAHNGQLLGPDVRQAEVDRISRSYLVGPIVYSVDFALSFVSTQLSLALVIAAAFFYAIAPLPSVAKFLARSSSADSTAP